MCHAHYITLSVKKHCHEALQDKRVSSRLHKFVHLSAVPTCLEMHTSLQDVPSSRSISMFNHGRDITVNDSTITNVLGSAHFCNTKTGGYSFSYSLPKIFMISTDPTDVRRDGTSQRRCFPRSIP